MYITSSIVYLLTHLMSLVSFYTPENFDLIPGYKFFWEQWHEMR